MNNSRYIRNFPPGTSLNITVETKPCKCFRLGTHGMIVWYADKDTQSIAMSYPSTVDRDCHLALSAALGGPIVRMHPTNASTQVANWRRLRRDICTLPAVDNTVDLARAARRRQSLIQKPWKVL